MRSREVRFPIVKKSFGFPVEDVSRPGLRDDHDADGNDQDEKERCEAKNLGAMFRGEVDATCARPIINEEDEEGETVHYDRHRPQ